MRRFLNLYWAELVYRATLLRRYALGTAADIATFYLLFMGIHWSLRSLMGELPPQELQAIAASQVIGYVAFYFVAMALSFINNHLREEVDQGTLEQLFLSPYSLLTVLAAKMLATFTKDLLLLLPLLLLLLASTGVSLPFHLPLLLVFLLLILGVYGFALLLGSLTLIFKRTGQLPFLFQILFLGLGISSPAQLPPVIHQISLTLPFSKGVELLKSLTQAGPGVLPSEELWVLTVNSIGYLAIGILVFKLTVRFVRDRGLLGRY